MRVLVTGGAGFIGASVALGLAARHSDWKIPALDNLRRRGSELNLARLREDGVPSGIRMSGSSKTCSRLENWTR